MSAIAWAAVSAFLKRNLQRSKLSLPGSILPLMFLCLTFAPRQGGAQCNPVLSAGNDTSYCANTCMLIAPQLTITNGCGVLNGAKVFFSAGYISPQDSLKITPQNGIGGVFNGSTGTLTLSGPATYAQYEQVLRTLCYKNSASPLTPGNRTVTIVLGDAIYNAANQHYYRLVNGATPITWINARNAAAATTYFGQQGYLVTITSAQENAFITTLLQSYTWLGASDAAAEGAWRWVTGCEGLEDNGQGRHISNQFKTANCFANTAPGVNGFYANWGVWTPTWSTGEPNDCGCNGSGNHCEDYAHLLYSPGQPNQGKWNDYPNSANVNAYIIEYGCMPGDSTLYIQDTIRIAVGTAIATTQSLTVCSNVLPLTWNGITIAASANSNPAFAVYHATSATGCDSAVTLNLTVNQSPVIVVAPAAPTAICSGASVSLSATGATTYAWSPGTGLSTTSGPTVTAAPAVTTTYILTGTTANSCTDTVHLTVTVHPLPPVSAGPDTAGCAGAPVSLQASGALQYSWSPAAGLSCTTCPDPKATPAATTTYVVTGTDANNCSRPDTVLVTVHPLPHIDAGPDLQVCEGASVQLSASGGQTYLWSPAAYLSCTQCGAPLATPAGDITYEARGTDGNGCSDSDQVTLAVIGKQPVFFPSDTTICAGASVQLSAGGGDRYLWYPAAGLSDPAIAAPVSWPDATVRYTVVVSQGTCFRDTGGVTLTVIPQPVVQAGPDHIISEGATVLLAATGSPGASYTWSPADGLSCTSCLTPEASPIKTTTYTITAANGPCRASDEVTVFVGCQGSSVFIPNTFTPNSDGVNDRLFPQRSGRSGIKRFRVFDRWGELLFEARDIPPNDASYGWDGMYGGRPMPPDVYVYLVEALCEHGGPVLLKGDITLIR